MAILIPNRRTQTPLKKPNHYQKIRKDHDIAIKKTDTRSDDSRPHSCNIYTSLLTLNIKNRNNYDGKIICHHI